MAKKAGDYDFSDVWSVGTTAAHTHHSEEERLRDEFFTKIEMENWEEMIYGFVG